MIILKLVLRKIVLLILFFNTNVLKIRRGTEVHAQDIFPFLVRFKGRWEYDVSSFLQGHTIKISSCNPINRRVNSLHFIVHPVFSVNVRLQFGEEMDEE